MKLTLTLLVLFFAFNMNAQIFNASEIHLYWKDSHGKPYITFDNIIKEHPKVRFLMNAGMYTNTYTPVGLYIENGKQFRPLRIIHNARVNYGIPPSGVFYINKQGAHVISVNKQSKFPDAIYATQSAPMLVINGKINSNLPKGMNIMRNGVGIRKDGKVVFACKQLDFRSFAQYFIDQGCMNALYLDGGISETWQKGFPKSWGSFGPVIGVE